MRRWLVVGLLFATARMGWCCPPAPTPLEFSLLVSVAAAPVLASLLVALWQSWRHRLSPGEAVAALCGAFVLGGVLECALAFTSGPPGYLASLLLGPLACWWMIRGVASRRQDAEPAGPGFSPAF